MFKHAVYSHRIGLRWYFRSTNSREIFIISLYPSDIKLLKHGIHFLIPPFKVSHIKGEWN